MDIQEARPRVGDDRTLRDLPVAVEVGVAELVDPDGHAVEAEVGELPVARRAEPDSATGPEREHIHHLRVVGVIDRIRERPARDHRIDHTFRKPAGERPHVRRVHMTVQDARDVVAVIDTHELTRQRITVAILDEHLLADRRGRAIEVHREVLAVEGQARKRHSLRARGS